MAIDLVAKSFNFFPKALLLVIGVIILVLPSGVITYVKDSGSSNLSGSGQAIYLENVNVSLYQENYSLNEPSTKFLGEKNYSNPFSVTFRGVDLTINSKSAVNRSGLEDVLLLQNALFPSDPLASNVTSASAFLVYVTTGNVYNRTFGVYFNDLIDLNFLLGGNGTFQSPATGQIAAFITQGKLTNGGLTYSFTADLNLGGWPAYLSSHLMNMTVGEQTLFGGEGIIQDISNWVTTFPNMTAKNVSDAITINSQLNMISGTISFLPDYEAYITVGVVTSIIPFGALGIIFLSENRTWKRKNEAAFVFIWMVVTGTLILSLLWQYYQFPV